VRPPTLLAAAFIFRGRELLAAFAAIAQVWVVLAFLDVLVQADLALVVFRRRGLVVDDPVSLQNRFIQAARADAPGIADVILFTHRLEETQSAVGRKRRCVPSR